MNDHKKDMRYIARWAKKMKVFEIFGNKCAKCSFNKFEVLDFHHNKDKYKVLGVLIDGRWSNIEKEMGKGIFLCANCHIELHSRTNSRRNNKKVKFLTKMKDTN